MTGPELPRRRALPADVRERMRRQVLTGVAEPGVHPVTPPDDHPFPRPGGHPVGPRRKRRGPLVAAAAAVLLVGVGAVAARHVQGPPTQAGGEATAAPRGFAAPLQAEFVPTLPEDLDACGVSGGQVATVRMPGRRLLLTPQDQYCELTYTTVARSDPAKYADLVVGGAEVLWRSPSGVVVLRPGPGATSIEVTVGSGMPTTTMPLADGRLVVVPRGASATVGTRSGDEGAARSGELVVRSVPDAAVVRDRFPGGSPDPADPDNVLARCLDVGMRDSVDKIDDSGAWSLGATVRTEAVGGFAALRGPGGATAFCWVDEFRAKSVYTAPDHDGDPAKPFRAVVLPASDSAGPVPTGLAGGIVRDGVAGLELQRGGQAPVRAEVRDGTFVAWFPGGSLPEDAPTDTRVRAFDRAGTVVYDGPAA
ncbi:hypothetical protein AB0I60_23605 [Actinosynnema sp. NPDC050436]|uniref:hypothetical protein n=1 Tax=Actinosynnema sp. NPDC050436 TaxID=3155659 RepID=UPI0033DAB8EE